MQLKFDVGAHLENENGSRRSLGTHSLRRTKAVLRSSLSAGTVKAELSRLRAVAIAFDSDRHECKAGGSAACNAALASPAISDEHRTQLELWRAAASPYHRAILWMSGLATTSGSLATDTIGSIRALPTSTHVMALIAAPLALALGAMLVRQRGTAQPAAKKTAPTVAATEQPDLPETESRPSRLDAWRQQLSQWVGTVRSRMAPAETAAVITPPPPPIERDTPGAIAAMELAWAYLEEVRQADTPAFDDTDLRKEQLNTLALATRQLELATKLDADAVLDRVDGGEFPTRASLNELKAEALLLEGITHQTYDVKRALPALKKATALDPSNARAFYVLGLTQAANMNKAEAVAAFERAVALDPPNLKYRKELNRAQSLTMAEIAGFKATRVGEKAFVAGIKTANAGILVYNIGVWTWNIFAVIWNVVTFPLRMMLKLFGVFDRLLGFK